MRILVYPHTMEIGGSQTNAIELAAAVRDMGHEVVVHAPDGPLVARVDELGLEHVPRRPTFGSPGAGTALHLRRLIVERGIDVVHGYEWPPILEGFAATWLQRTPVATVGTVMSMSVAPFIPDSLHLVVGTARIRAAASLGRRGRVHLIEPPVDTVANAPGRRVDPDRVPLGLDSALPRIVIVCRLVADLKLEGLLTAVRAAGALADRRPVQLLLVGDGPAAGEVRQAAEQVNRGRSTPVVVLAGEHADPRWAYDSADICVGMGGSALRALAFGKPLVVQGEGGFFETLTPQTLPVFLDQGWFGTSHLTRTEAVDHLVEQLTALLDDPGRRAELGSFGQELVESRFSLTSAAAAQEEIYREARADRVRGVRRARDSAASGVGLLRYKIGRRVTRLRGGTPVDSFPMRVVAPPGRGAAPG